MDPITGGLIAGAGMNLVGSLIGGSSAKRAAKRQAEAAARIAAMYDKIDIPDIEKQKLILDELRYQGDLTPEMMEALGLDPSQMESVEADAQFEEAQRRSLEQMQDVADGGLTEADMAAARQMQRQVDNADVARRKSVLNQMAQRGVLGSGMELAAQLQSAQEATQNQSDASDRLMQQAQSRALEAIARTGNMADQARQQDFNEQSARAKAADAISQFNLSNRQDVLNRNVGLRNAAQERNLDAQQRLNNANIALRNEQQQFNKGLLQQQFRNRMDLTDAKAGRQSDAARASAGVDMARGNMAGSIFGGLANAAVAGGQAMAAQNAANTRIDNELNSTIRNRSDIF